jgi:hypothetical protein
VKSLPTDLWFPRNRAQDLPGDTAQGRLRAADRLERADEIRWACGSRRRRMPQAYPGTSAPSWCAHPGGVLPRPRPGRRAGRPVGRGHREGLCHFPGHQRMLHALAFCADGRALFAGCPGRTTRIGGLASKEERHRLEGSRGPVRCLALDADGRVLASGGGARRVFRAIRDKGGPYGSRPWTQARRQSGSAGRLGAGLHGGRVRRQLAHLTRRNKGPFGLGGVAPGGPEPLPGACGRLLGHPGRFPGRSQAAAARARAGDGPQGHRPGPLTSAAGPRRACPPTVRPAGCGVRRVLPTRHGDIRGSQPGRRRTACPARWQPRRDRSAPLFAGTVTAVWGPGQWRAPAASTRPDPAGAGNGGRHASGAVPMIAPTPASPTSRSRRRDTNACRDHLCHRWLRAGRSLPKYTLRRRRPELFRKGVRCSQSALCCPPRPPLYRPLPVAI